MNKLFVCALMLGALALTSCRDDEPVTPAKPRPGQAIQSSDLTHLYVLSEGAWGQNNARLDRLGFASGLYAEDVYTLANPNIVMGLGDVANDLREYRGRLYAVLNGSHKVTVMDAGSLAHIADINVSSPRNIAFDGDYAYVSSWVGGADGAGSVRIISVQSNSEVGSISVGFEPEGVAVANGRLYVAVSGGMHAPDYDNTVWVFDLSGSALVSKVEVGMNPHRLVADAAGNVWASWRGDYGTDPSGLARINPDLSVDKTDVPCAGFALGKGRVYYYSADWSNASMAYVVNYGSLDGTSLVDAGSFITDGSESSIAAPYGIAVDASTGRVFLSDAKNYASSGAVYVYSPEGRREQTFPTGICPSSPRLTHLK